MRKVIFIFICISNFSCNHLKNTKENLSYYLKDYSDVIGKKMDLGSPLFLYNAPSIKGNNTSGFKVVTFINTGCSECIKKMDEWKNFLFKNNFFHVKVEFIAQGVPDEYFKEYVKKDNKLNFYIYLDTTDDFLYKQNLTQYFQNTFLLDKYNKILMVGDPIDNERIYNFYRFIINDVN